MSRMLLALIGAASLVQAGPVGVAMGQSAPCPRKPSLTFEAGSVTVIRDQPPPCRVEVRETGIRLEAVADGSRPDPGRTVVIDSHGRFVSANARGWESVISVWDAQGRYLSSFGRSGEGPGEFSPRGMLTLMIDSQDHIHIRDGAPRWSVFSPQLDFIRQMPALVMGGLPGRTVILDGGSALASDGLLSEPGYHFRVADPTGTLERTFGPVGDGSSGREMRQIAYAGGDTFWAGPGTRNATAYVLEEWGIDGQLRRTLRREVEWWEWRGETPISPTVFQLHIAPDGLLYVLVHRPTDEYVRQHLSSRRRGEVFVTAEAQSTADSADYVVEVIDLRSGQLLASDVYSPSQVNETLPRGLFRGSLMGYRHKVGDDGLPLVEIVVVDLVPA